MLVAIRLVTLARAATTPPATAARSHAAAPRDGVARACQASAG
jgi:hypothetical protein